MRNFEKLQIFEKDRERKRKAKRETTLKQENNKKREKTFAGIKKVSLF